MKGRRLSDGYHDQDSQAGDYWRTPDGAWQIRDPLGSVGSIGDHDVVEHEDGTITVTPSIQDPDPAGWHGHLERGVWREA